MRRASVFFYLSASHEMRRKGFASSGILHSRSCFTWFATASPDRTAPRSRDGAKEIRVSVRMPAYRDRSLDRTTHRAVTAEFPELRLWREHDRANVYVTPAPLGQPTRPYPWKATTTLNVAPPRVGSSGLLPSLYLARARNRRARSLPPSSFISRQWAAHRKSRRRGPPRLQALLTRWRARSYTHARRWGIDDKIVFTSQSDIIKWRKSKLIYKVYIYIHTHFTRVTYTFFDHFSHYSKIRV